MLKEKELKEAVREAIQLNIPFLPPEGVDFSTWSHWVGDVAEAMGYARGYPHEFKDRAWAFHVSADKGLRWGYVRNDSKVGWYEGRETTPLPERALVIKDGDVIYGHAVDRMNHQAQD